MLRKLKGVLNRSYNLAEIDKQQLEKMVKQGAILVDVRSLQEFQEGHLEKAISIPEYEIREKVNQMLPDKLEIIIVYCSTGHRGIKAQKKLQRLGYQNVYNLYNGLDYYD